jgi:TPR repeat protein
MQEVKELTLTDFFAIGYYNSCEFSHDNEKFEKDSKLAYEYLEKASDIDYAKYILGRMYQTGYGLEKPDFNKALEWYRQTNNCDKADLETVKILYAIDEVERIKAQEDADQEDEEYSKFDNDEEHIERRDEIRTLLTRLAKQKHPEGMFLLYEYNHGYNRNTDLLRKSADAGFAEAQFKYAMHLEFRTMYYQKDIVEYYLSAGKQGITSAYRHCGDYLLSCNATDDAVEVYKKLRGKDAYCTYIWCKYSDEATEQDCLYALNNGEHRAVTLLCNKIRNKTITHKSVYVRMIRYLTKAISILDTDNIFDTDFDEEKREYDMYKDRYNLQIADLYLLLNDKNNCKKTLSQVIDVPFRWKLWLWFNKEDNKDKEPEEEPEEEL